MSATEPDLDEGQRILDTWNGSRDAIREGWMIWPCAGSDGGHFQIQAIDEVGECDTRLPNDEAAWLVVRTGTGEHHRFAREFIAKYNPKEWAAIEKFCEGMDTNDPTACECDNTHQSNDTVCRWCWARGRRHWGDPEVQGC